MERGVIRIQENHMTLIIGDHVAAHAYFSRDAAADGTGAWVVSSYPSRLFSRGDAITALSLTERIAAGYGDDDLFIVAWQEQLYLGRKS